MKHCLLLIAALLPLAAAAAGAERQSLDVRIVSISDGDTITVVDTLKVRHRVRLAGIDAPEDDQPFGDHSKQNLAQLLQGGVARIEWSKTDQRGRFVAVVTVESAEACASSPCPPGIDVGLAQVSAGMAWHYKYYEKEQSLQDRSAYAVAEQQARDARIGLWSGPNPVAPYEWRSEPGDGPVKKSRNNICHAPSSPSYKDTRNFERFGTLEACLASGGRLPRNP